TVSRQGITYGKTGAMPINLPIVLTWGRMLAIPLLVAVYYLPLDVWQQNVVATVMFVIAAVTDWVDGYLARRLGQTTAFGAFLDPVADKLLVCAALVMLVQLGRVDGLIAVIIVGREIAISALREWMARVGAQDRKSTRLNSSHVKISYAVFCLKKKRKK